MEARTDLEKVSLRDNDSPKTILKPSSPDSRFRLSFALLCIINLVCAIDATILSVALPTIAAALHGTAIEAFWTGTSFLLTSTVFVPTWISFSHIIDRKSVIITSIIFFTLGSILASVAKNFSTLLAGRSIQGIGGGGIGALTNVIISDLVGLRDRGKWWGFIGLMWALGALIGPIMGGAFAERNWRWIFYINLPFCGIALVGIPLVLKLHRRPGQLRERMKEFDWIGSFLFITGMTSILVPLSWGGVSYPWSDWRTVLPLMSGVMGLLAFLEYSRVYARYPLIRGSIFATSTGTVNFICTSIYGLILWSLLYYMPLYYQVAKNQGPIMSGVVLFPFTLTTGPASVIISIIIGLTGRYRPSLWLGWSLAFLGVLLMLATTPNTSLTTLIFLQLPPGVGFGVLYPAMSFAVQAAASDTDLPFAAAMFSFFRTLGQAIGVAVSGNIFQNSFRHHIQKSTILGPLGKAEEWSRDASALVGYVRSLSNVGWEGMVKKALVKAYCDSLRVVVIIMCVLAGVAMCATLVWTKGLSLDRELRTEQGWKGGGNESGKDDGSSIELGVRRVDVIAD